MRVAISPLSFRCTSPTDDGSLKFHTKRRGGREGRVGTTAAYFASSSSRARKIGLVGKRGTITLKEVEGSSVLTAVPLFFCRFSEFLKLPHNDASSVAPTQPPFFPSLSSRKKRSNTLLPPSLLLAPSSRTNYPPPPRLNFRGPAASLAPPPPKGGGERDNLLFSMPLKLRPGHGAIRLPYSSVLCVPLSALVHSSTPR